MTDLTVSIIHGFALGDTNTPFFTNAPMDLILTQVPGA